MAVVAVMAVAAVMAVVSAASVLVVAVVSACASVCARRMSTHTRASGWHCVRDVVKTRAHGLIELHGRHADVHEYAVKRAFVVAHVAYTAAMCTHGRMRTR